nr:alpha/beta hydrolase [Chloroflexota bacterium]
MPTNTDPETKLLRSPSGIPYVDWGGQGPLVHFAHANGFPPGTYSAFVKLLIPQFHVLGMECRALWGNQDPAQFRHWRELGDDLARFLLEMQWHGVVAIGHSLGAVTSLLCAVAHAELIRALVLIDPVILPPHLAPVWALAMSLRLNRRAHLPTGARRRRMEWPNKEVLFRAYRAAPVFARWQDDFLRDYITSGTKEHPSGSVYLRYPREWEARIFETVPPDVWLDIPRLRRLPLLVIRGQHSDTYTKSAMRWMQWLLPHGRFLEIEGADHFVPMSKPEETAEAIRSFVKNQ